MYQEKVRRPRLAGPLGCFKIRDSKVSPVPSPCVTIASIGISILWRLALGNMVSSGSSSAYLIGFLPGESCIWSLLHFISNCLRGVQMDPLASGSFSPDNLVCSGAESLKQASNTEDCRLCIISRGETKPLWSQQCSWLVSSTLTHGLWYSSLRAASCDMCCHSRIPMAASTFLWKFIYLHICWVPFLWQACAVCYRWIFVILPMFTTNYSQLLESQHAISHLSAFTCVVASIQNTFPALPSDHKNYSASKAQFNCNHICLDFPDFFLWAPHSKVLSKAHPLCSHGTYCLLMWIIIYSLVS